MSKGSIMGGENITPINRRVLKRIDGAVEGIYHWFAPRIPTTVLSIALRRLNRHAGSILDVGCGPGVPMYAVKKHKRLFAVGIDVFLPYLKAARERRSHDALVLGDVRYLPFRAKSFDVAWCMEVIEHLKKEDGFHLIRNLEEIARKQVIITTPLGAYRSRELYGNPHQEHEATWGAEELRRLGYRPYFCGLRGVGDIFEGERGVAVRLLARPFQRLVWALSGILTAFIPKLAGDMVCVKALGGEGE
jgi:SAM-dependent methyltransferase